MTQNTNYKYPYIPKDYYAAVMFACKMIRENGYFNQACERAARYYGVDADEIAKHVRKRQGAGQMGKKNSTSGRKYHWFIVVHTCQTEANGRCVNDAEVVKALNKETAAKRFSAHNYRMSDYSGSSYDRFYCSYAIDKQFDSEEEAQRYGKEHWEEIKREYEW